MKQENRLYTQFELFSIKELIELEKLKDRNDNPKLKEKTRKILEKKFVFFDKKKK